MALVPVPDLPKLVVMGHMVEGRMPRVVVKVEEVVVDKMVGQEVDLVLVLDMVKRVDMTHMVVVMLRQVGKGVAVGNMVVLDKVPVLVPVMVKLVVMDRMVVDMLKLVVKAAAVVVGKVVPVAADLGMAREVVLGLPVVVVDTHKTRTKVQFSCQHTY
jgi:hypothetical protein